MLTDWPKYAVLASGTGSIFQAICDADQRGEIPGELSLFITDQPDCYALERAKQAGVETRVFKRQKYRDKFEMEEDILAILRAFQVQYIVMAGYMRILSPHFISHYKDRIINTHPSLLPAFKGLDAVKQAYDYGVKVTGCTVHLVTEKMDDGPVLMQTAVQVEKEDTVASLTEKIKSEEKKQIITAIKALLSGRIDIIDNHRWVMLDG